MILRKKIHQIRLFSAVVVAVLLLSPQPPAVAQDVDQLLQRLERLERDLQDLQRSYYRGEKPRQTGGGSAAKPTRTSGPRLAEAEVRMSQLESQMRQLTGRVEEVQHGIDAVKGRLDKLVADVDFRLNQIEARLGGGGGPSATEDRRPAGTNQASHLPAAGATGRQRPAQANAPRPTPKTPPRSTQTTVVSPTMLPQGNAADQYNYAFSLLRKADFARAELAFTEFLAVHGDDRLAGNAYYWLGETYYSRNKLQDAARVFLTGFEKFPDGVKAPDTLLKLAITLSRMNQREEACSTLGELKKRFVTLSRSVSQRYQREWQKNKCG